MKLVLNRRSSSGPSWPQSNPQTSSVVSYTEMRHFGCIWSSVCCSNPYPTTCNSSYLFFLFTRVFPPFQLTVRNLDCSSLTSVPSLMHLLVCMTCSVASSFPSSLTLLINSPTLLSSQPPPMYLFSSILTMLFQITSPHHRTSDLIASFSLPFLERPERHIQIQGLTNVQFMVQKMYHPIDLNQNPTTGYPKGLYLDQCLCCRGNCENSIRSGQYSDAWLLFGPCESIISYSQLILELSVIMHYFWVRDVESESQLKCQLDKVYDRHGMANHDRCLL